MPEGILREGEQFDLDLVFQSSILDVFPTKRNGHPFTVNDPIFSNKNMKIKIGSLFSNILRLFGIFLCFVFLFVCFRIRNGRKLFDRFLNVKVDAIVRDDSPIGASFLLKTKTA